MECIQNFDIWKILGIITVVLLIVYWGSRNAVWGGLTIGLIIGFIIAMLSVFKGSGFGWYLVIRAGIVGTMIGFFTELLGQVGRLFK